MERYPKYHLTMADVLADLDEPIRALTATGGGDLDLGYGVGLHVTEKQAQVRISEEDVNPEVMELLLATDRSFVVMPEAA